MNSVLRTRLLLALIAVSFGVVEGMGSEVTPHGELAGVVKPASLNTSDERSDVCCDEDPEQWAAVVEEFQAVSDRATHIQPEEMPAYWRLLSWVREQPIDALRNRAQEEPLRNAFLHHPASLRGKLYNIDLQICRVLPYEVPDNRFGVRQLYEVWGFTRNSGAWLYVVITPELPAGFPTGATVSEAATVSGYFFKLQGYLEAGAVPRSQPLQAPLFLGKMDWRPQAPPQLATGRVAWLVGLGALFILLTFYRVTYWHFGNRKRRLASPPVSVSDRPQLSADQWLQRIRRSSGGSDDSRDGQGGDR